MSFTEKKFSGLSKLNRYKKTAYIIKEHISGNSTANSPVEIITWFNKYENENYSIPEKKYDWGLLTEILLQKIEDFSAYNENNSFDNSIRIKNASGISLLLDNIRSPYNTGAIIRTAEALGVEEVILSGITPGLDNSKAKRTSMNSQITVSHHKNPIEIIQKLKQQNYQILSIEKNNNSIDIANNVFSEKKLIIFGNEEFGISEEILEISDQIYHIELKGSKNSLNVSVASGIALYEIVKNKP